MRFEAIATRVRHGVNLLLGQPLMPKGVHVGRNVFVGATVRLDPILDGALIDISDNATIAPGAVILCHDASSNRRLGATWVAPVHVGVRAFIGENAILLPGVRVGADSIVAAGAVVTKDVEPGTIVAGIPAVRIGSVENIDRRRASEMESLPLLDSEDVRNWPQVPEERRREILAAVEKHGGFFSLSRETFEAHRRGHAGGSPPGRAGS